MYGTFSCGKQQGGHCQKKNQDENNYVVKYEEHNKEDKSCGIPRLKFDICLIQITHYYQYMI